MKTTTARVTGHPHVTGEREPHDDPGGQDAVEHLRQVTPEVGLQRLHPVYQERLTSKVADIARLTDRVSPTGRQTGPAIVNHRRWMFTCGTWVFPSLWRQGRSAGLVRRTALPL